MKEPIYLYFENGGGTGGIPITWDFYYAGVYWDAYSINPNQEVYYDHPDYEYYYKIRNVGPAVGFTIDTGFPADNTIVANHISRSDVRFLQTGGIFMAIAGLLAFLGVDYIASGIGLPAAPVIEATAAFFALIDITTAIIASVWLPDETGSGWVFYKPVGNNAFVMKIGCSWWILCTDSGPLLIPSDGHYIR